jgi:hypothetical protein
MEYLGSLPSQSAQALSSWLSEPTKDCNKPEIQSAVTSDLKGKGADPQVTQKAMLAANQYFKSMSTYMADQHKCALEEMDQEKIAFNNSDRTQIKERIQQIASLNDQIKIESIDEKTRQKWADKREHLIAMTPYGIDAGAREYLLGLSSEETLGFIRSEMSERQLQGLEKYAEGARQRLRSDFEKWDLGRNRSEAAIKGGDPSFVGTYFDTSLSQVAQDPALFAHLNTTLKKKLKNSDPKNATYDHDVGRCLISARFGDTRKTISAGVDTVLLLSGAIPFAGWGVALYRGFGTTQAAVNAVQMGGRISTTVAKGSTWLRGISAERSGVAKNVGRALLATGGTKAAHDCYKICYESNLGDLERTIKGEADCKQISVLKRDLKRCAINCARETAAALPGAKGITPVVPDAILEKGLGVR